MSTIEKYESLKIHGTWIDRWKYTRSLADKTQLEQYLKQSNSADDLGLLVFFYKSIKDKNNLLDIANSEHVLIGKRCQAINAWLVLETDEKRVYECIVEMVNNVNIPRKLKKNVVKYVRKGFKLKQYSSSFYSNLGAALTQSISHEEYNIMTHILPYCSSMEQVSDLLNRWSITKFSHIDYLSPARIKLVRYHPLMVLQLIKADLESKYSDQAQLDVYFRQNQLCFFGLIKKAPKGTCEFIIDYLNRLEPYRRALPSFMSRNIRQLFKRAPDEMIELIKLVASHSPGKIKITNAWDSRHTALHPIDFPSSFSIEHYVRLFFVLYETCKWSANHLPNILELMLESDKQKNHAFFKERKWFLETVVKQRIGIEEFTNKLLQQANESTLTNLNNYFELSAPLAHHLLAKLDRETTVVAEKRLNFLYYEPMTVENFDRCVTLFKEFSSEIQGRNANYPKLFKCSIATSSEIATKALQWILKRLKNEQLIVVENFIKSLTDLDDRFHVAFVTHHQEEIEAIFDIAINHIQRTTNTLETIQKCAVTLLTRAEYCRQLQTRDLLHSFGSKIIKKCFAIDYKLSSNYRLPLSLIDARRISVDILADYVFPKILEDCSIRHLEFYLDDFFIDSWREPKIDAFLVSFFFDRLRTSKTLQAEFKIDEASHIISTFLKQNSTRVERAQRLIDEISPIFLLDNKVQQIVVKAGQHRQLIDRLLENEQVVTGNQLTSEEDTLLLALDAHVKLMPFPGLNIATLRTCLMNLTGKQQKHIVNIILNSYLQEKKVTNLENLKALRILSRIPSMYGFMLEWINKFSETRNASAAAAQQADSSQGYRATENALDDIILCLPTLFDLKSDDYIQEFHKIKSRLNAANAKYMSNAMAKIADLIPTSTFLSMYLEFISDEKFAKLGITVNKEILRLLIKFKSEPNLILMVIQTLWNKRPHEDIRVCLIDILLRFLDKFDEESLASIWFILDQAASDEYLPVVQKLFPQSVDDQRWPLAQLANMDSDRYTVFVNRIQLSVLNHPTKLEARNLAWLQIDDNHCNTSILMEKTKVLSSQFNKKSNFVWKAAYNKMLVFIQKKRVSSDILIDIFQSIMSNRDRIDNIENAIDSEHDLLVYRRVVSNLELLIKTISGFTAEHENSLRAIANLAIQFEVTLAKYSGLILIRLSKTRDELYVALNNIQHHLTDSYAQQFIAEMGSKLDDPLCCPFVGNLSVEEKLTLVQWFCEEKGQDLFVFDLAVNCLFRDSNLLLQVRQDLLRRFRKSNNILLRQKALNYEVNWTNDSDDDQSRSDMSTTSDN